MEDRSFYVYQLRSAEEQFPFYIGKGKGDRAYQHLRQNHLKENSHKANKIKKLLREGVKIEVEFLEQGLTSDEAFLKEREHISKYGIKSQGGLLTNQTEGGDGGLPGYKHSEETKSKMSEHAYGRVASERTRKALDRTGKGHSDESKVKISEASRGRKHSEETKAKIGAAHKGKKIKPEAIEAQRSAVAKEYDFISPSGEVVHVKNLTEFSEQNGLNRCCMTLVNQGVQPVHRGWRKACSPIV